ncbi:MAG: non-canonical purine NTP pyrophosphatase [Nanobdellota archaeon]
MRFITGNKNKFREAQAIMPDLIQEDRDLPEIQELDPQKIIEHKLAQIPDDNVIVEDISLFALSGFPGPLIKWMLKSLSLEQISQMLKGPATAQCMLGVRHDHNTFFISTEMKGTIVSPRHGGFGFDPIFQPEASDKTLGEEKSESMRTLAFRKLKACTEPVAMVFGCFDCMHPGHTYYFRQAKQHGAVVAVVARDETIKNVKKQDPHHPEEVRLRHVRAHPDITFAELGSSHDKYESIRRYRPSTICLGHDQEAFTHGIQEVLKKEQIDAKILRIQSHRRDRYRSSLLKGRPDSCP